MFLKTEIVKILNTQSKIHILLWCFYQYARFVMTVMALIKYRAKNGGMS